MSGVRPSCGGAHCAPIYEKMCLTFLFLMLAVIAFISTGCEVQPPKDDGIPVGAPAVYNESLEVCEFEWTGPFPNLDPIIAVCFDGTYRDFDDVGRTSRGAV